MYKAIVIAFQSGIQVSVHAHNTIRISMCCDLICPLGEPLKLLHYFVLHGYGLRSCTLPTNDAPMRHGLSIRRYEFIGRF